MSTQSFWQNLYTDKAADEVSWYQAVPTRSLEWIRSTITDPAASILDVGGGASFLVDHLLELGYSGVAVLDLAPAALAAVQHRLAGLAARVEWFAGDVLDFRSPHPFDFWHDRAVLHFLIDPGHRKRYADVLRGTVRPGGSALIATFAHGGPTRCSGLEIVQYDCREIADLLGEEFTCVREDQELHRTPSGGEQRFQYCLFARRST